MLGTKIRYYGCTTLIVKWRHKSQYANSRMEKPALDKPINVEIKNKRKVGLIGFLTWY